MIMTVAVVGLGAVGAMYCNLLTEMLSKEYVYAVADRERTDRFLKNGIYINNKKADLNYICADEADSVDLVIVATKSHSLSGAIDTIRPLVGDDTLILSAINGIFSERELEEHFGAKHVVRCVAQGMDAVRDENCIYFTNPGKLCFGEDKNLGFSPRVASIVQFFERAGFPHETPINMLKQQWGKFMLNVGINQVCAVMDLPYGGVQCEGKPREMMIEAMKEVMALSTHAGVMLNNDDLSYWIRVADSLTPESMPSMRQDILAGRKTEVEIFAGAVLSMSETFEIHSPVNEFLFKEIQKIEKSYL